MANIEIVSIRLNLDKEDDRRLFETLRQRLSQVGRSRNEFLKHLLLYCLTEYSLEGEPAKRSSKNQESRGPAEEFSGRHAPVVSGAESGPGISQEVISSPVDSQASAQPVSDHCDERREFDAQTAAFVATFLS